MNLESIEPGRLEIALELLGAQSITLTDAGDDPVLEPAPGETPLWARTRVTALFASDTDFARVRKGLCAALDLDVLPDNHIDSVADRDWEREWLKDFAPMQFGENLWICPAGMQVAAENPIIVELDPGLAFGSGTHPTTALCLEWLARNDIRDARILDLGCGSGILGIAALKMGAAAVDAVDIDLQAITATRQNAERNEVGDHLQTALTMDERDGQYDIVLANILAGTLIDLASGITERVQAGGWLVLSGILLAQAKRVAETYDSQFKFDAPANFNGWTRLAGMKR